MNKALNLKNITPGKPFYQTWRIADLRDMLKKCDMRYGDRIAFNFRREPHDQTESKTYHQFIQDIDAFGTALMKLGLSGSHIAIIGENRYEWIVAYLAAVNGAGVAIPIDKMLPQNEVELLLKRGRADVLIYSRALGPAVEGISGNNKNLKAVICMNEKNEDEIAGHGFYSFQKLLEQGRKLIDEGYDEYKNSSINPDKMSILLFTSGTSSAAKAVMLSHTNICSNIMGLGGFVFCRPGESVLSVLPLNHTFENTVGLLFPLYLGVTISISDGLRYLSKNLTEYRPDLMVGVPLLFDKFKKRVTDEIRKKGMQGKVSLLMLASNALKHLGIDVRRKLFKQLLAPFGGKLRVIVSGGAGMDPDTANWYENIGIRVYQGYGLTETSPVLAGGNDRMRKSGTCGEPLPGVTLAIHNADAGGAGEIVVKGKSVMLGYWKNPAATKEAITEGWFHTGDLGRIDRRGLVCVTGRVKSMIVLKNGKKVFPEELESHINEIDYVKESMVWGETADDGTVELCSKIILDRDKIATKTSPDDENSIRRLLDSALKDINKLMPIYKRIRYYVFSYDELIKTTTMKIKRYVETDQIRHLLKEMCTNIKNAAGKNIDKIKEMLAKRAENY